MTANCRWVSTTEPRVIPGRHGSDCAGEECRACLPCVEPPISSGRCGTMNRAGRCANTPRPLTHSLDLSKEGLAMNATSIPRSCSAPGCEKDAKTGSRQFCSMHYARLYRTGSLEKRPRLTVCQADDCERPVKNAGLCSSHYIQKQASERPERVCELDDCNKRLAKTSTRKVCEMHYNRMRVHGSYNPAARTLQKDQTCVLDDCDKQARNRGFCGMHAERIRHNGSPHVVRLVMGEPELRFWALVDKEVGSPCWLWTGNLSENGYGAFSVDGGRMRAHRYSYELHKGLIPEGLTIDHVHDWGCRNRSCVNPDHLEAVTQAENNRRARAVARQRKAGAV